LISFIPKSARSEYPSREFLVPSIQNSNTDMPVCYMQTVAGRTLNLSRMCGKQPTQPTVICPEITDPKRRALAKSCGNNAFCLANLECQPPPPPRYLPTNGALPG
jgi:hypothetical protein